METYTLPSIPPEEDEEFRSFFFDQDKAGISLLKSVITWNTVYDRIPKHIVRRYMGYGAPIKYILPKDIKPESFTYERTLPPFPKNHKCNNGGSNNGGMCVLSGGKRTKKNIKNRKNIKKSKKYRRI